MQAQWIVKGFDVTEHAEAGFFNAPIATGRIQLYRLDAVAWLAQQPPGSLDWVYLDSAHDDFHVMRELHQSYRAVKAGGWICGHDYTAVCPGVVAAVDRFCRQFSQHRHPD